MPSPFHCVVSLHERLCPVLSLSTQVYKWVRRHAAGADSCPVAIYVLGEKERRLDSIEVRGVTWEGAKKK